MRRRALSSQPLIEECSQRCICFPSLPRTFVFCKAAARSCTHAPTNSAPKLISTKATSAVFSSYRHLSTKVIARTHAHTRTHSHYTNVDTYVHTHPCMHTRPPTHADAPAVGVHQSYRRGGQLGGGEDQARHQQPGGIRQQRARARVLPGLRAITGSAPPDAQPRRRALLNSLITMSTYSRACACSRQGYTYIPAYHYI